MRATKLDGEAKGLRIRKYADGYCILVGHYIGKDGKKHKYQQEFPHMDILQDALGQLGNQEGWCNDDTQPDWLCSMMPADAYDEYGN